ncbi:cytochrome P450 [Sphingosinicella rhizophila]|uniref:Cytochrome P450 n=1 Tax=Sphingosinicella rhizophila TaxID=3050082 RepID=A0ABU3QBJ9_9SPHN|nr:cytochrome P450 [Sphingosinicella sp. GR2756]MDT9600529.1 cytochrome P450 [Sphingosinicella sp. GR2756]
MMPDQHADEVPSLHLDPFDLDVLRDPHEFQKMLRDAGPAAFLSKYNCYAVGRYEEVRTVLRDWQSFGSGAGVGLADIREPGAWREAGPIVEADPPSHDQVRAVLNKIISPAVIRGWKQMFEAEAAALADRLCDMRDIDGAKDVAEAYVLKVFPDSLGIEIHRDNLIAVGNHNFNSIGPQNELFKKSKAAIDAIADWYTAAQQRDAMIPGGFGERIFLAEEAGQLECGIASKLVHSFLRGGMDTTISGIGTTLMFLSQHPQLWLQLRTDRSRLKMAFEEAIRLESPAQSFYRTIMKPVQLGGFQLRAGRKIHVFIGAANRDPRKWTDPDSYDIYRATGGHLAFGQGIHVCIGQMIARLEAECILNALLDRVECLEERGTPTQRLLNSLRTLETLPLRITPA